MGCLQSDGTDHNNRLVLFIFSSSLLKCLLFTSILSPNSVNIFITNVLNSLSHKLVISVSVLFFQFFFLLAVSVKNSSSAFSFCLTFSASMNLGVAVTYCNL